MQGPTLANRTEKHPDTNWNAIDWHQQERRVRNLRQRIFRATQAGDWKRVRSLQKLMLRSHANRLVSVRRVAQLNTGKNTPGVDKVLLKTPEARGRMVDHLAHYQLWMAKPARRVYIPKANGKQRPLGIPMVRSYCPPYGKLSGLSCSVDRISRSTLVLL
jgi:RNA-directed DNA polymerase